MPNFKLIGFDEKMKQTLFNAICTNMLLAGFKHADVVVTFMPYDKSVIKEEIICAYGFSDNVKEFHSLCKCLPNGIKISMIDSRVKNLKGKQSPYVEVYADTSKIIDEIVAYMKKKHLGYDVEKRIIPPSGTQLLQKYEYPCVKAITSEEDQFTTLMNVLSELRKLGVNITYAKIIDGSVDAKDML